MPLKEHYVKGKVYYEHIKLLIVESKKTFQVTLSLNLGQRHRRHRWFLWWVEYLLEIVKNDGYRLLDQHRVGILK